MESRSQILFDYRAERDAPDAPVNALTRWLVSGYPLEEAKHFIGGLSDSVIIQAQHSAANVLQA